MWMDRHLLFVNFMNCKVNLNVIQYIVLGGIKLN